MVYNTLFPLVHDTTEHNRQHCETLLEYSINRKVTHTYTHSHTQTGYPATTCRVCFLSFLISTPVFPTFSFLVWPGQKELPWLDQPPLYITSCSCWWRLFWGEGKADGMGKEEGGGEKGKLVVLCFTISLTCLTPTWQAWPLQAW